jgi:hypothetical protein
MPSIEQNKRQWDVVHHWPQGGAEWSQAWGGAEMQWHASILPRIHAFVPAPTILEIAPGFGRWTHFLKDLCDRLIVVDLSNRCLEACQKRFKDCRHIAYHHNDGKSLAMVPDDSIDFVFSFDSLVHADADVLKGYLGQLGRKMRKDAVGFIHHSNLGECPPYFPLAQMVRRGLRDKLKFSFVETTDHWRAYSMTATKFRTYAQAAGLSCISQELITWLTQRRHLIDCFSMFTRHDSIWARENLLLTNHHFMDEADGVAKLSRLYATTSFGKAVRADTDR